MMRGDGEALYQAVDPLQGAAEAVQRAVEVVHHAVEVVHRCNRSLHRCNRVSEGSSTLPYPCRASNAGAAPGNAAAPHLPRRYPPMVTVSGTMKASGKRRWMTRIACSASRRYSNAPRRTR